MKTIFFLSGRLKAALLMAIVFFAPWQAKAMDPRIFEVQNPADLLDVKGASFKFSLSLLRANLNSLAPKKKPLNLKLPTTEYDYKKKDPIETSHIDLNIPLFAKIHFGLTASLPADFLKVSVLSGQERTYLRHTKRKQRPEIYTALAFPLTSFASLGLGIYHTLKMTGRVQVLVDEDITGRAKVDVTPIRVPYGGVRLKKAFLGHLWRFGIFYRGASNAEAGFETDVSVATSDLSLPANIGANFALFYEPEVYSTSLVYSQKAFSFYLGYELARWSLYQSPLFKANSTLASTPSQPPLNFEDTRGIKAGIGKKIPLNYFSNGGIKLGIEHHTSALPDNPNSLMVVDLSRRVYKGALELSFHGFSHRGPEGMRMVLSASRTDFLPRTFIMDNEAILAGGRTLQYEFSIESLL